MHASNPAFALGTFLAPDGVEVAGLVVDGDVHALGPHLGRGTTVGGLLDDWDESFGALRSLARRVAGRGADYDLSALRALPPVWPPRQVFQAGANYRQHVAELIAGHDATEQERLAAQRAVDERARTGRPYVFLGLPHSVVGARDDVVLPMAVREADWELELAAVIGRRAWRVSREEALSHVAGYTICNDITARDHVYRPDLRGIGSDWLAAKNWPTFFPTGPYLVPAACVEDPMSLEIRLWLNGQPMQDSTTADMMFDIARLIEHASSIAELRPGDLLLTGSPPGNGVVHKRFLRDGDVIDAEITGLGRQRNRCVAEVTQAVTAG
jgi:2-keto-4-pentenoate hydratase/2-oxohepta-3-ene-1,7-dioic acid hydratase in catechol pathway